VQVGAGLMDTLILGIDGGFKYLQTPAEGESQFFLTPQELGRGVRKNMPEGQDARGADQYRPNSCRTGKAARMAPKLKYPAGPADVSPDSPPKPKAKRCPEHSVIAVLQRQSRFGRDLVWRWRGR